MRFRTDVIYTKKIVIREYITPLRANQIAGITSDFKILDIIIIEYFLLIAVI